MIRRFVLLCVATVFLSGCNFFGMFATHNLSVSVESGTVSSRASYAGRYIIEPITDDTYYKSDRQDAAKGTLVNSFTPEEFILDLDTLKLYRSGVGASSSAIAPLRKNPDEAIIPRHVNIIQADSFVREFEVTGTDWDGIYMQFLPFVGIEGTGLYDGDRMNIMSYVALDLGAEYAGVVLPNELSADCGLPDMKPNLHYFAFKDIQPFNVPTLSYLIFGSDVEQKGVQNPEGDMPPSDPGYWELPGETNGGTSGNTSMILNPGPSFDFSKYSNPEIVFIWDVNNLVQVWDAGTPGVKTDDIVTFNLENPFPVGLEIQEKDDPSAGSSDSTAPGSVFGAAITGRSTHNTLLWINPSDEDFKEISIIRKEGSSPADENDGTEVYRGYEPNFCDTGVTTGVHYYYKIFAVDYSGNLSAAVGLDRVVN